MSDKFTVDELSNLINLMKQYNHHTDVDVKKNLDQTMGQLGLDKIQVRNSGSDDMTNIDLTDGDQRNILVKAAIKSIKMMTEPQN
jgi:hypothetical protein